MTVNEGLDIVLKNRSDCEAIACLDYGDFYAYALRHSGTAENQTGPYLDGVLKSNGETFIFNLMDDPDAYNHAKKIDINADLKHFDPTEYLMSLGCNMDTDIIHYGTKRHSGRYPWGSGERPYQGESGASKKSMKRQGYFARKKAARQRQETLRKVRAAADAKRRYEAEKERAINSGDIKFAYENRYRLTDAELNKVLQRVDMNRKLESALKDLSKTSGDKSASKSSSKGNKEYMKLKEKFPGFDNFMGNVGTVNSWMATALKTYQNIQAVQKILNGQAQEQQKPKEEKKKK